MPSTPPPGEKRSIAASRGSTSRGSARTGSALRAGLPPTSSTPAIPSTRRGRRSSGTTSEIRGRGRLNSYPLEGLGVAVSRLLPYLSVPLAHELLEIPFLPWLGDLALVLLQRLDLEVERGSDVDQVIARRPVRNPHLLDDVRLVALLEEASESPRDAGVGVDGGQGRLAPHKVIGVRAAHRRVHRAHRAMGCGPAGLVRADHAHGVLVPPQV